MFDLVDLKRYKSSNNEFKFLLTIIDVFSKFAFVYPLNTKGSEEVDSH